MSNLLDAAPREIDLLNRIKDPLIFVKDAQNILLRNLEETVRKTMNNDPWRSVWQP